MKYTKEIYGNKGTWLAFAVLFICYFIASNTLWNDSVEMEVVDRPSAFMFCLEPILFGGIIRVFPFCACLPGAMYCGKASLKKHPVLALIMGGIAVTIPFIIHTILWNILAIPSNPDVYPSHELQMFGLLNDLYDKAYGIPIYLIFSVGMFLCGGAFSLIYLFITEWIHNNVAAFVLPGLLYFIWQMISLRFTWLQLPAPMDLFDEGLTIRSACILLFVYTLIIFSCIRKLKTSERQK